MPLPLSLLQTIRGRAPTQDEVLKVFGAVLFAVCGWSIRGFLYKIPAFALYFGLSTDLAILCYMFGFALLESLIVTAALVGLAMLFPARWLREGFAYKGFVIVLVAAIGMIAFENYYRVAYLKDILAGDRSSIPPFVTGLAAALVAIFALLWLFRARPLLQRVALALMGRLSIFAFIYVPLGLIGLIVVLFRNLR